MCLLGIDIGTSGCKATVIDYEGRIQGQAYREYALVSPRPGWQEIDPEKVWSAVKEVIIHAQVNNSHEAIKAISVSSFGETAVPVDSAGNALYNGILYIDSRGQEESAFLKERMGNQKILEITGTGVQPMFTINKVMWLKKHKPDVYLGTWKFMLFADYVLFKLGARPHTDYSLAARTMAFNITEKAWSSEIFECAGVDIKKFGEPVQAGILVGKLSRVIAGELRLPADALLVAGGHDQPCAALGAGAIDNKIAVDGMGTTECITPVFDHPVISGTMAACNFACVPHVVKDRYVTYAFTFTSGSLLKWYRDRFGSSYVQEAEKNGVNVYDLLIGKASGHADNLFVLPHFAGAATPYMDTAARGAIVGLDINTTAQDILQAILEGITFEMMINVGKLDEAGVAIEELRAVGGLAKSAAFLQLKADMMGRKITTLQISEAGTLGVAILAGTAAGIYTSIAQAVDALVKTKQEFLPNPGRHAYYMEKFETYKKIYPAMRSIFY